MLKITFIGAGSLVFTRNLCNDILLTPALRDSIIMLMDIDATRLERSRNVVEAMIQKCGVHAQVCATLDRREAVQDAQYVITTFQLGSALGGRVSIYGTCRSGRFGRTKSFAI